MYRVLAEATQRREDHPHDRRDPRGAAPRGEVGLVPTMGALPRRPPLAVRGRARGERPRRRQPVRQPGAVRRPRPTSRATRATRSTTRAIAEEAGVDVLFAPAVEELYPPGYETWVDVESARTGSRASHRPGHFRGVATVCLKLFNIVRPRRAYFGQKDAQQVEVVRRMIRDLNLDLELRVAADRARRRRPRALVAQRAALARGARARARPPPRAGDARPRPRARSCSTASTSTTSRSRRSTRRSSPPPSASAPPA